MNKIISLLMIPGLLGASGVALAEETACAKVDAKGNLNIQCVTVKGANYSVVLTHHLISGNENGYFTYDGGITDATVVSQKCAKTDNDLNIKLPCVEDPSGTLHKVTMSRVPGSELRWDLASATITEIQKVWLFVHTAKEAVLSGSKLTMPAANDIFAFTDRPYRENMEIPAQSFVKLWTTDEENSFYEDNPNAVITYAGDGGVMTAEEVVIEGAVFANDLITYNLSRSEVEAMDYTLLQSVSVFIDDVSYSCAEGGPCQIGDTGPGGGTIIYVAASPFTCAPDRGSQCHYLEALTPQGPEGLCPPTYASQLRPFNGIGLGSQNTYMAKNCEGQLLAKVMNMTDGGKDDWFVPSKDEMQLALDNNSLFAFGRRRYYSSSSKGSNSGTAYSVYADTGYWYDNYGAASVQYVLPMRSF